MTTDEGLRLVPGELVEFVVGPDGARYDRWLGKRFEVVGIHSHWDVPVGVDIRFLEPVGDNKPGEVGWLRFDNLERVPGDLLDRVAWILGG